MLLAVGVVEVFPNGLPLLDFVAVQLEFGKKFGVVGGLFGRQPLGTFGRVFQAPRRHEVGVVVVVDVVFVFVRAGYSEDDKLFMGITPVDALRPEAGNSHEHLQAALGEVAAVLGVANVVVDAIRDGAVAVDLLKGDFPLVVAFLSVHGDHGVEGCAVSEAELLCVFNGFSELLVAVDQEVFGHALVRGCHVEGQAVGFSVPVGGTAVLLAGEALRPDVQAGIDACKRLQEVEDVEANALLR